MFKLLRKRYIALLSLLCATILCVVAGCCVSNIDLEELSSIDSKADYESLAYFDSDTYNAVGLVTDEYAVPEWLRGLPADEYEAIQEKFRKSYLDMLQYGGVGGNYATQTEVSFDTGAMINPKDGLRTKVYHPTLEFSGGEQYATIGGSGRALMIMGSQMAGVTPAMLCNEFYTYSNTHTYENIGYPIANRFTPQTGTYANYLVQNFLNGFLYMRVSDIIVGNPTDDKVSFVRGKSVDPKTGDARDWILPEYEVGAITERTTLPEWAIGREEEIKLAFQTAYNECAAEGRNLGTPDDCITAWAPDNIILCQPFVGGVNRASVFGWGVRGYLMMNSAGTKAVPVTDYALEAWTKKGTVRGVGYPLAAPFEYTKARETDGVEVKNTVQMFSYGALIVDDLEYCEFDNRYYPGSVMPDSVYGAVSGSFMDAYKLYHAYSEKNLGYPLDHVQRIQVAGYNEIYYQKFYNNNHAPLTATSLTTAGERCVFIVQSGLYGTAHVIEGTMLTRWLSRADREILLGAPISDSFRPTSTTFQNFERGYVSSALTSNVVSSRYMDTNGTARYLNNIIVDANVGEIDNSVSWNESTVKEKFVSAYKNAFLSGTILGAPVSDVKMAGGTGITPYAIQYFENTNSLAINSQMKRISALILSAESGECVLVKDEALNAMFSYETGAPKGSIFGINANRYQNFEKGCVYLSASGNIVKYYDGYAVDSSGGTKGTFRNAVSNAISVPVPSNVGQLYSHPTGGTTGQDPSNSFKNRALDVKAAYVAEYSRLMNLGIYPGISDSNYLRKWTTGSYDWVCQNFVYGDAYANADGKNRTVFMCAAYPGNHQSPFKVYSVYNDVAIAWMRFGGVGNLGIPTSNQIEANGVIYQNFFFGYITVPIGNPARAQAYMSYEGTSPTIRDTWLGAPASIEMESSTENSITLKAVSGAEYAILRDGQHYTWQSEPVFSGLQPNTSYHFAVRYLATAVANKSNPTAGMFKTLETRPNPPQQSQLSINNVSTTSVTLNVITGAEYACSLENTSFASWQDSTTFNGLLPGTIYYFAARFKATGSAMASDYITISQKTEVGKALAPSAPTIQSDAGTIVTLSTVADCEYSMSTDNLTWGAWQDSPEFTGLDSAVTYYFRQRIKAVADRYEASDPSASTTRTAWQKATAPSAPTIQSDAGTTVTLASTTGCEYSISTNNQTWEAWQDSPVFTGLDPEISYYFRQRVKAVTGTLASDPSSSVLRLGSGADDREKHSAYGAFTPASKTQNTVTLFASGSVPAGLEFGIHKETGDHSADTDPANYNWQISPIFSGLTPGTEYTFAVRYSETSEYLASDIDTAVETTQEGMGDNYQAPYGAFTPVSKTQNTVTLFASGSVPAGLEFGIHKETGDHSADTDPANYNWQVSPIFSGLTPGTEYTFAVRYSATADKLASEVSTAVETTLAPTWQNQEPPEITTEQWTAMVITATQITAPTIIGAHYAILRANVSPTSENLVWQSSPVFSNLSPATLYMIYVKYPRNDAAFINESDFVSRVATTLKNAQEAPISITVQSKTKDSITIAVLDGAEYGISKDGGTTFVWGDSNVFTGLNPDTEYIVAIRFKETATLYASPMLAETLKTDVDEAGSAENNDDTKRFSAGQITGIVFGSVGGAGLIAAGVLFLLYFLKKKKVIIIKQPKEIEKKEAPKKEPEKTDAEKKEPEKSDAVKTDAEKKEPEKSDAVKTDAEKKEPEKSDAVKTDAEKKEPEKSDAVKTEAEKKEPEKSDAVKTDAEKKEPEKGDAVKTDAEKKEPEKSDAVKTDAEKKASTGVKQKTNKQNQSNKK